MKTGAKNTGEKTTTISLTPVRHAVTSRFYRGRNPLERRESLNYCFQHWLHTWLGVLTRPNSVALYGAFFIGAMP
jgi:hypothetical protein